MLFVSSAYKAGSRAIRLRKDGDVTSPEELWFTNRVRFMFLNAVRVGDHIYGTGLAEAKVFETTSWTAPRADR